MQNIPTDARRSNSVKAMFEDGMATFLLSSDATLGELAGRLGHLAKMYRGRPIAFDVKLGSRSH